jgi:hypothetical protein
LVGTVSSLLADETWDDGGGNDNYNNGANWVSNTAPSSGETVNYGNAPGSGPQIVQYSWNTYSGNINFNSSLSYTLTGGSVVSSGSNYVWTISGSGNVTLSFNQLNLSNSNLTILNNGTGTLTIDTSVGNWSGSNKLILGGSGSGSTILDGSIGGGVSLDIAGGNNTITAGLPGGFDLTVSGGNNIFDTEFGGGTTLDITGGSNSITGGIGGGADIIVNATGGSLSVDGPVGGGAEITVDEGQLSLGGDISGGASILVEQGGTLLLDGSEDAISVGGGGNITLNGGTLAAQGSVTIPNVTLTADSTIDLLDDVDADLNLGNVTVVPSTEDPDPQINVVNYENTNQVGYNSGGSNLDPEEDVTFNGNPAMTDPDNPNIIIPDEVPPVPEPGVSLGLAAFVGFLGWHAWQRRRRTKAAPLPTDAV